MNTTFARILQQILDEQNVNLTILADELYSLGLNITYSALYSYYSSTCVPPFSTAKKILHFCKIEISDKELENILEVSKKIARNENIYKDRIMRIDVKIKPEIISQKYKYNPEGLKNIIEMRADEIFGDEELVTNYSANGKRKLGAYISYLIKKDLLENEILEEETFDE